MMKQTAGRGLGPGLADSVLEALEGGIIVLDSSRRILSWNRWMARSAGISAADAMGRPLLDVFPSLLGTRLWTAVEDALAMGVSSLLTYGLNPSLFPLRYRDGRALLHSVSVRMLPTSEEGDALCLLQLSDVTASVDRERLLRDRRDARHRAVVDTAADAIVTTNLDGVICWVNPAAEQQFGYSMAELEGTSIRALLGDGASAWMQAVSRAEAETTAAPCAVTGRCKNGAAIELELSLGRWQSGGRSYATGILRDVTERRREQERLRLHKERALLLARAATQLLAASDPRAAVRDLFGIVAQHLRLDAYFHYVVTEDGSALELAAHGGIREEEARVGARLELGEAICGNVALSRVPATVTGIQESEDPKIRFIRRIGLEAYVRTPLMAGEKLLGTLGFGRRCPGSTFDEDELRFLRTICHYVAMVQERLNTQAALRASEQRLRLAVEGTGMATWDIDLASGRAVWSRHHFLLLGYEPRPAGAATLEMWFSCLHPENRAAVEAEWARARREDDLFRASFRIRRVDDGAERWMDAYGRFLREGGAERFIGVLFDVTERKAAEERQKLLMREVDHRAKNVLAVVRSVLRLTRAEDPKRYAEAVEGRVSALARAHTLLADDFWSGAALRAVAEQELAAYRGGGRIWIGGPPARLVADAVQPLSMALHELATNAAKYGALSAPGGRVEVSWRLDSESGNLLLRWAEHDGPPILAPPERRGFGSTLVETVVRGQLGGRAELRWEPSGLICDIEISADKLISDITGMSDGLRTAGGRLDAAELALHGVSLRGRRVLVAEDEPVVAMELQEVLTKLGCEVLGPATTVEEALSLATAELERGIDAAVLDVNLHGRTIYAVADTLARRGVPIVYATGYGELPDGRGDRDLSELLRKPVINDDLEATLRRLLAVARSAPRPS